MARIPIYQPQEKASTSELTRTNPVEAGMLGNSIAGFGQALSGIGQEITRHDTLVEESQKAAQSAAINTYHKIQWEKVKQEADPNSPDYHNLASKFMAEVVDPNLQALSEGITTDGAKAQQTETNAKMREEMALLTAHDQTQLTGVAVQQDAITVRNATSTSVAADPSSFDSAVGRSNDERLRLQRAGLDPVKALEWQTESNAQYAQSAIRGAAQLNPDKAQAALDSGKYDKYLTGEQKAQLTDYITREKRTNLEQQRSDAIEQRRQDRADADKVATQISASLIDPETRNMRVPPDYFKNISDKYSRMPGADPSEVRALESAGRAAARDVITKSDPYTHDSFLQRVWLAQDDPTRLSLQDVNEAFGAGQLSKQDYAFFHKSVLDAAKDPKKTEEHRQLITALTGYKRFITQSTMFAPDAYGDQRWSDFQRDKTAQFEAGIAKGLTPSQMTTEGSKDYIFGDTKRYEVPNSLQQMQEQLTGRGLNPQGPVRAVPWANAPKYNGPAIGRNPAVNSTVPKWDGKEPLDKFLQRVGQ